MVCTDRKSSWKRSFAVAAAVAAAGWAAAPVLAQDGTWNSPTGGTWNDTTKWEGGVVANGADSTARFIGPLTATATVTLDMDRTIGNLVSQDTMPPGQDWIIGPNAATPILTLSATGTPNINVINSELFIDAKLAGTQGFIKSGGGTLRIRGNAARGPQLISGPVTISGGTIRLVQAGGRLPEVTSFTIGSGTNLFLDSSGNTGMNDRVSNTAPITINSGTLRFAGRNPSTAGAPVSANETTGPVTFTGGSTIRIEPDDAVPGDTFLTLASLARDATATMRFVNTGGGTLGTQARILFTTPPPSPDFLGGWATTTDARVAYSSDFARYDAAAGVVPLGAVPTRSDTLAGAPANADVRITSDAPAPLDQSRTINSLASASAGSTVNQSLGGHTLTLASGGLLRGVDLDVPTGSPTQVNEFVISNGTLTSGTGQLFTTIDTASGVTNILRVDATLSDGPGGPVTLVLGHGGRLSLTGANTYTGGTIVHRGNLIANNTSGSALGSGGVTVNAGSFSGTGAVAGPVTMNDGTLAPGEGPGTLQIAGNLTLAAPSTFSIELAGKTPGDGADFHDQLNVTGAAALDGTLNVTVAPGFLGSIVPSDRFLILTRGGGAGAFDNAPEGAFVTFPGGVTGRVTYMGGDGNDVELYDVVPEPAAAGVLGLAALGLLARRRGSMGR